MDLPERNLHHLRALTDDTGMLQHAVFRSHATRTATAWTTTPAPCCLRPSSRTLAPTTG